MTIIDANVNVGVVTDAPVLRVVVDMRDAPKARDVLHVYLSLVDIVEIASLIQAVDHEANADILFRADWGAYSANFAHLAKIRSAKLLRPFYGPEKAKLEQQQRELRRRLLWYAGTQVMAERVSLNSPLEIALSYASGPMGYAVGGLYVARGILKSVMSWRKHIEDIADQRQHREIEAQAANLAAHFVPSQPRNREPFKSVEQDRTANAMAALAEYDLMSAEVER